MKVQSVISEISAAHGLSNTGYILYPDLLFSCEKYMSDMVHILCVYSQIGNPTKHRHFRLKRGMKSGSLSLQIFSRPEWKYLIMILTWNSCPGLALSFSTLSPQTLLSLPSSISEAQDCLLFLTEASWVTCIFRRMHVNQVSLVTASLHGLLISLPVNTAAHPAHHHLLLGPGIFARHWVNSTVWK